MHNFEQFQIYQGLIFDMDGTVIDTMPVHAKAWQLVGEFFGYPLRGDVMYQFGGAPVRVIAEQTMRKYGMPLTLLEEVLAKKREISPSLLLSEATLLPAAEVVKHFYQKKPLALGTGSHRAITEQLLEKMALRPLFDAVVTSEDVQQHKPQPETFLRCAQLIKVEPKQCLVFEDADLGVQAGLSAGMHVYDVRTHQILTS